LSQIPQIFAANKIYWVLAFCATGDTAVTEMVRVTRTMAKGAIQFGDALHYLPAYRHQEKNMHQGEE
jgi:hypothetical protein